MSNVVAWNAPPRRLPFAAQAPELIQLFAAHRRHPNDVFWLKENAELLGILQSTGVALDAIAFDPLGAFYDDLGARLQFFPQYYRFFLSIGLDLEELGHPGTKMERLCTWVAQRQWPGSELSDLQRAEARRLLERRGVQCASADAGLDARLHAFISRPETFAIPNKRAAYELTHIVFYLSNYGCKTPNIGTEALQSLEYAGILALLDQNFDLLAEICTAMHYAGKPPNPVWVSAIRNALAQIQLTSEQHGTVSDDYHPYLVANWALLTLGIENTSLPLKEGRHVFRSTVPPCGALAGMSSALLQFEHGRQSAWAKISARIFDALDDDAAAVLETTVASSSDFEMFFDIFARA